MLRMLLFRFREMKEDEGVWEYCWNDVVESGGKYFWGDSKHGVGSNRRNRLEGIMIDELTDDVTCCCTMCVSNETFVVHKLRLPGKIHYLWVYEISIMHIDVKGLGSIRRISSVQDPSH